MVTAFELFGSEMLVHLDVNGNAIIATALSKFIPVTANKLTFRAELSSLYLFDAKTEKSLGWQLLREIPSVLGYSASGGFTENSFLPNWHRCRSRDVKCLLKT